MLRYRLFIVFYWAERFYHLICWTVLKTIRWPYTYILGLNLPKEERQRINKQYKHIRKIAKERVKRERPKIFAEIKAYYTQKEPVN